MSTQSPEQFIVTLSLGAGILQLSIAFSNFVLGLAHSGASSQLASEVHVQRAQVPLGAWQLALALALTVPALASLRGVRLWAWRASVIALAATVVTSAAQWSWIMVILELLTLWLLLAPPLRSAANRSPQDRALAELEDRVIRRARRRLTDDEPSLRDIHLAPPSTPND